MSEYVNQYVSTVVHGIGATFTTFKNRRYYDAAHDLLPILRFVIVNDAEKTDIIEAVVKEIERIPDKARLQVDGSTKERRAFSYDRACNVIAYDVYLKAVGVVSAAIKDDILAARYRGQSININKLDFSEIPDVLEDLDNAAE